MLEERSRPRVRRNRSARIAAAAVATSVALWTWLPGSAVQAQEPPPETVAAPWWQPLSFLLGSWTGEESGRAGVGKGVRGYSLVLDGKFLFGRNRSVFVPQERNPEGEVHQDWQIFSYDKTRETVMLRQFHTEGFVHRYALEEAGSSESGHERLVLVAEAIENAPGFSSRLVFERTGPDTFTEVFYLGPPGQEPAEFLRNHWTRKSE